MDTVPTSEYKRSTVDMVRDCLRYQTDKVSPPFIPSGHLERIPDGFNTDCVSEWCDRCGCNHGSGTTHGTVYEYTPSEGS